MSALSNVNASHSELQLTDGTTLSQTTSSPPQPASILNNARNVQINNAVFATNTTNTTNLSAATSPLALLYKTVASNAILNAGGRADEVGCHPGTREEVISVLEKSIAQEYSGPRILWLSGPAGAGKSAIMQTVAERCRDEDVPHANFFFFRGDKSRSDATPFVATIIHQVIQLYPSIRPVVTAALNSNPLLLQMGIQEQFHALLHKAVAAIYDTAPSLPPLTLLIDGLDECDSETKTGQRQLLQALDTSLIQKGSYFRVVIASRVEPQISMAFGQLQSGVDSIFLDEKYSPEKDIHRFVTAEFNKIKSNHYLASSLGSEWPSESDIEWIVAKSSGQFIFAATVMRFIAYSSASPILSLQKVHGIVPPTKNSPFSQIDAIYAYILGQVEDWEAVKALLAIKLLNGDDNVQITDLMFAYKPRFSKAVIDSCLSELAPLVTMEFGKLEFFHASFPDFLQNQPRSRKHHINLETFCAGAFPVWWKNPYHSLLTSALLVLKKVQQPTSRITTALMDHNPRLADLHFTRLVDDFVEQLHRIYSPNGLQTFNKIMHIWASGDPDLARYIPQSLFQSASRNHLSTSPTRRIHGQLQFPAPQIGPSATQMHLSKFQTCSSLSQTRPSDAHIQPPTHQPRVHPHSINIHPPPKCVHWPHRDVYLLSRRVSLTARCFHLSSRHFLPPPRHILLSLKSTY